jgi:hypothetical protein
MDDPQEAVGEKITYWSTEATIIGVVRDFQTVTLHEGQHPVVLTCTGYFVPRDSQCAGKRDYSQARRYRTYISVL